jgi:hypothetical protein
MLLYLLILQRSTKYGAEVEEQDMLYQVALLPPVVVVDILRAT